MTMPFHSLRGSTNGWTAKTTKQKKKIDIETDWVICIAPLGMASLQQWGSLHRMLGVCKPYYPAQGNLFKRKVQMSLTPEQLAAREGKLTASGIAALMTGDEAKIYNLWRMLICDPSWSPEDLSDVWPVQLGNATEKLHLDWIARKHGQVSRRGEVVVSKSLDWAACTLDGWADQHKCPIEAKHVGGFETREAIVQRYYPQMTWQMVVTGAPKCMLSVIEGAREPTQEFINYDKSYADELMARAKVFMQHVHDLTPPVHIEPVREPVTPFKTYDFSENNVFVSAAWEWLQTKILADKHKDADKTLKEIIPADAVKVTGGGIIVSRDRANRLRVKEEK